jgi:hypothetical protein
MRRVVAVVQKGTETRLVSYGAEGTDMNKRDRTVEAVETRASGTLGVPLMSRQSPRVYVQLQAYLLNVVSDDPRLIFGGFLAVESRVTGDIYRTIPWQSRCNAQPGAGGLCYSQRKW